VCFLDEKGKGNMVETILHCAGSGLKALFRKQSEVCIFINFGITYQICFPVFVAMLCGLEYLHIKKRIAILFLRKSNSSHL
jgi:hypothetical protein